jgi:hypothetical protein
MSQVDEHRSINRGIIRGDKQRRISEEDKRGEEDKRRRINGAGAAGGG